MSEVYYRKWRPQRLGQVVGQEPVVQTLRQAVVLGRVAHAYLLCGPRGTGKTSTARILAKAVNCLSPQDGEPDNQCGMCRAFSEGRSLDLIEIDAASHRGIDDIRNLSDKVRFMPSEARYKVYIVDEVHMLTEPAFNALLKTLEEPPPHAIFVLATTEVHKVPPTVISRCQRFDFRLIPLDLIVNKLRELCDHEEVEVSFPALSLIARTARGSLRDAENLLEQAVVSYGSPITEEQVRELLGLGWDETALELVGHVISRRVLEALRAINQVAEQGHDLRQLHRGVMECLRGVLLAKSGAGVPLGYAEDVTEQLESLADATSMLPLLHVLKTFAAVDLKRNSASPLPLELAVVESAAAATIQPVPVVESAAAATIQPVPVVESAAAATIQPVPVVESAAAATIQPVPVVGVPPRKATSARDQSGGPDARADVLAVVKSEPNARLESQWDSIVKSLRHTGKRFKLGALLRGCKERYVTDGLITLKFPYASHVERMRGELDDPVTRRAIQEVLTEAMDAPYDAEVSLAGEADDGSRPSMVNRSHLVRAAQAKGARVVGEVKAKEGDR